MARQGHRVWVARLTAGLVIAAVACFFVARALWNEFATEARVKQSASSSISTEKPDEEPSTEKPDEESKDSHPLDPLLEFARKALRHHVANHQDYTAVLVKREQVKGKVEPESKMAMKLKYGPAKSDLKPRPVSVYLRTLAPKYQEGREVIWVQGRNDDKITAHEAGLLGMVSLDLNPESRLAMNGNRYPITQIGIENLLNQLIHKGERDRKLGPVTVRVTENAKIGDRTCRLMEIIHESPSTTIEGQKVDFEFHLAQIYIDDERLVPLKYASFSWPKQDGGEPILLEEYTYLDLVFNVGLTEKDFDPKNAAYRF